MAELTAAARFIHFVAITLLAGGACFRLYAGFSAEPAGVIAASFDTWLRRIGLIAAFAALLSAMAWADSLAVSMGGDWSYALDWETFRDILFDTNFGRVWVWRLGAIAALIVLLAKARAPWTKPQRILIAFLAVCIAGSIAGVTHAAMHVGVSGSLHQIADALHLVCAAIWLGGLAALGFTARRAYRDDLWLAFFQRALSRFSAVGIVAVTTLMASGIVNTWFLASPASLTTTAYGRTLLAKIALFLLMVGLASVNRLLLLPRVRLRHPRATVLLYRAIAAEQGLGLLILVLVSILGILPPPH